MKAECNIVYKKTAGNPVSWSNRPANYVRVLVREWLGEGFVIDYVLELHTETNNISETMKELIYGDLDKAVRRGIAVFDEELAKHPVLGKA